MTVTVAEEIFCIVCLSKKHQTFIFKFCQRQKEVLAQRKEPSPLLKNFSNPHHILGQIQ